MPQLAHTINMPVARAGNVADSSDMQDTISRLVEDAAGALAGTLMVPGTDAEAQAIVPTTTGEVTNGAALGVAVYDASKEPARTAAALAAGAEYDVEQALPILSAGRIWVLCDAAATIAVGDAAFVRFAAGAGGSVLGTFREDADTATAVALPNAVFRSAHQDVDFQDGFTQRVAVVELGSVKA